MTIQDIIQILTAIGVILTAVVALVTRQKVAEVHDTVNGAAKQREARITQLAQTLQESGTPIPAPLGVPGGKRASDPPPSTATPSPADTTAPNVTQPPPTAPTA